MVLSWRALGPGAPFQRIALLLVRKAKLTVGGWVGEEGTRVGAGNTENAPAVSR